MLHRPPPTRTCDAAEGKCVVVVCGGPRSCHMRGPQREVYAPSVQKNRFQIGGNTPSFPCWPVKKILRPGNFCRRFQGLSEHHPALPYPPSPCRTAAPRRRSPAPRRREIVKSAGSGIVRRTRDYLTGPETTHDVSRHRLEFVWSVESNHSPGWASPSYESLMPSSHFPLKK